MIQSQETMLNILKYSIIKYWTIVIVRKKVTLKTKTFLKYLQTTLSSYLWHTVEIIKLIRVESTYNLWVTMWLRAKEAIYTMKDQRMKTILNPPAALSGCLPPLRPGLNQTTESDLLRESWGGRLHMTACCVMHDTDLKFFVCFCFLTYI